MDNMTWINKSPEFPSDAVSIESVALEGAWRICCFLWLAAARGLLPASCRPCAMHSGVESEVRPELPPLAGIAALFPLAAALSCLGPEWVFPAARPVFSAV
jgi:hypothetical protein